jgi:hypothetical protein
MLVKQKRRRARPLRPKNEDEKTGGTNRAAEAAVDSGHRAASLGPTLQES